MHVTLFGWMISGRTPGPPTTFFKSFHVSIDDSLRKFWELEEIPDFKKTTTEEDRCESHFKETTILQNGRFTVRFTGCFCFLVFLRKIRYHILSLKWVG